MSREEFKLEDGRIVYLTWDGITDRWAVLGDIDGLTFRTREDAQERARQVGNRLGKLPSTQD